MPPKNLTPLELRIMQVLWASQGPMTVQQVVDALPGDPLAYTTVQTMLNILERKGQAKRRKAGRAFEYRPAITAQKASSSALKDLVNRLFHGSAEDLVMSLVESRQLDAEKIERLLVQLKQEGESK